MAWRSKEDVREKVAREAMPHLDHLYRVAFHVVKDPADGQDLVQETYARALSRYEQFVPGTNLKAWLTRILHNLFFDDYRQAKRRVSTDDKTGEEQGDYWETQPSGNPGPESNVLRAELSHKITDAIKKLPEEFRIPVVLVDMSDFPYAEAAEILACPVGTVRSRIFRGRQMLRAKLRDYIEPDRAVRCK